MLSVLQDLEDNEVQYVLEAIRDADLRCCVVSLTNPCKSSEWSACLQCLRRCREEVCAALGLDESAVELSMGMSGDYLQAVCICSRGCQENNNKHYNN